MGAKAIIARYMERNRSALPSSPEELRQHVAAVAKGANLALTEKELDELAPKPKKQDRAKGQKSGDFEAADEKGGNTPTVEI